MKRLSLIGVIIFTSVILGQTATAPSTGDGSSGSPYQIATWQNLYWLSQNYTHWNDYYTQTANIDLNSASPAINTWDSNKGWTPIGNTSTNFTGSYNGQGYNITGLYINRSSTNYVGLFGYVNGATISSIELINGSVSGSAHVGGLIGAVYGSSTITKSYNTGTVSGTSNVGGLIGYNYNGTVTYSYNSGTIGNGDKTTSGAGSVGGLVGQNHLGLISNCYNTGTIDGGYWGVGGLVGYNNTDGGTVDRCYSMGLVDAYPDQAGGAYRAGGLVGDCCTRVVSNSYWDVETSNNTHGFGTSKTTAQMKTQSTFSGWDFTTIWQIVGGDGANYPSLRDNPDSALPVELISFTVIKANNQLILSWSTATEINNYGFSIERSVNNKEWKSIAFVSGSGNSNSQKNYSYADLITQNGKLQYRLKQIDFDGKYEYSSIVEVFVEIPVAFVLHQNNPNPFNPLTTIKYEIPITSHVNLKIYDLIGNEIAVVVNEQQNAGTYSVDFNGEALVSGVYFYQLLSGPFSQTKKFILMK